MNRFFLGPCEVWIQCWWVPSFPQPFRREVDIYRHAKKVKPMSDGTRRVASPAAAASFETTENCRQSRIPRAIVMRTRDELFDLFARKTPASMTDKLFEWSGRTDVIDKECFVRLGAALLGDDEGKRLREIEAVFDYIDMLDGEQDDTINFLELIRRARHEVHFAGKLKINLQKPIVIGNKSLAKYEEKYKKKTDAHVREYARWAAGALDKERRDGLKGIITHRRMEMGQMQQRNDVTQSKYEYLHMPGGITASPRAAHFQRLRPSLMHSASTGSIACRSISIPSRPTTSGSLIRPSAALNEIGTLAHRHSDHIARSFVPESSQMRRATSSASFSSLLGELPQRRPLTSNSAPGLASISAPVLTMPFAYQEPTRSSTPWSSMSSPMLSPTASRPASRSKKVPPEYRNVPASYMILKPREGTISPSGDILGPG